MGTQGVVMVGTVRGDGPESILKVEQTGLADGLDREGERNRGVKSDSNTFGWAARRTQLTSPGVGKEGMGWVWGEDQGSVLCMLHWRCLLVPQAKMPRGQLDV